MHTLENLIKNGYHRVKGRTFFENPLYLKDHTLVVYNHHRRSIEATYTLPPHIRENLSEFVHKARRNYHNLDKQVKSQFFGCNSCVEIISESNVLIHYAREHYKKKIIKPFGLL